MELKDVRYEVDGAVAIVTLARARYRNAQSWRLLDELDLALDRAQADRSVGVVISVDEALMDAITAVSGSGPAYVFYIMESLERAAIAAGLEPDAARLLVGQTILGSAELAQASDETPRTLRARVTSPRGTTEAAVQVLDQADVAGVVERAVEAGIARGAQLRESSS